MHTLAAHTLGVAPDAIASVHVFKRSFDARKVELLAVYIVDVALADPALEPRLWQKVSAGIAADRRLPGSPPSPLPQPDSHCRLLSGPLRSTRRYPLPSGFHQENTSQQILLH